jgi:hypothetical protein
MVKKKLNNMDLSAVTEEFAERKRAEAEAQTKSHSQSQGNSCSLDEELNNFKIASGVLGKWIL